MTDHIIILVLACAAGATRTPDDALVVLNVLPAARSPLTLAAVLSRGFYEYQPSSAAKHGHALALLSHYPSYILFDDLSTTLAAAGARGDLPTIELLWQLTEKITPSRRCWFKGNDLVTKAILHGHVLVLDWMMHASRSVDIQIKWPRVAWEKAAKAGLTNVIHWAIDRGLIESLSFSSALLSTQSSDTSLVLWWISQQPSKEAAMAALKFDQFTLTKASSEGLVNVLDCWWTYSGSELPDPTSFAHIIDGTLSSISHAVVEWWWTRFLEHRTPEHKFGTTRQIGQFQHVVNLVWYWRHYKTSPKLFPHASENNPHGLIFTIGSKTTLSIVQWAVETCAELDNGQKLTLAKEAIHQCIFSERVDVLELLLGSVSVLEIEWPVDFVASAVSRGQFKVLEWWDRNRLLLPPQDLTRALNLFHAAGKDCVQVLAWWHARGFPVPENHWQRVCDMSIFCNARRVQLWFLDHPDLIASDTDEGQQAFAVSSMKSLCLATPFTLDFFDTIVPNPDFSVPIAEYANTNQTTLFWRCIRANVTVASLLPLNQRVFGALFRVPWYAAMLEWWVQAHIDVGVPVSLPAPHMVEEILF
ncbi:hypothetical protein BC828DRAFT_391738, partial [Blastocladiella britannica]